MFDFTHTKRPDLIQLVLLIAVVCLALGAITPSASAVEYEDLTYSSSSFDNITGTVDLNANTHIVIPDALSGSLDIVCDRIYYQRSDWEYGYFRQLKDFSSNSSYPRYDDPNSYTASKKYYFYTYNIDIGSGLNNITVDNYVREFADWLIEYTTCSSTDEIWVLYYDSILRFHHNYYRPFSYSYQPFGDTLDLSLTAFAPDDPAGMYVLSLDGSLLDTTYTVGINRYTDEFKYLVDSYAYTDGAGSYTFTGSRSLTLPIFYNSFTNMPYSYEVSVNVNDEDGYLDERYLVYWSDLGGLYDTVPDPLVPTPTPTQTFVPPGPVVPSDIIPDPESLNNTVNITGWYQDQGFEGNNITAPIYSGLRGWFNENIIPFFDFFLMPIGSLSSMITDSASTSTDAISDSVDQLSIYASPMVMVGGYVVQLVPNVVWVVVFAALSIGYVVLLIRISTGSIKDTINRFLGGR